MPKLPRGLGPSALQRLKDFVTPSAPSAQEAEEPTLSPGMFERVLEWGKKMLGDQPQIDIYQVEPPRSLAEVRQRIQVAGRNYRLLKMAYTAANAGGPTWRDVEPYSFRYRAKDEPWVPLFFGYCHKDASTEAYKLQRINHLQVTDKPFSPQWAVEF
jgi:predicted DNA-binding transcriptional regulator YafY